MTTASPILIGSSPSIRSSPVPLRKPSPRQGSNKPTNFAGSGDRPGYKFFEDIHKRNSVPVTSHAFEPSASPQYIVPVTTASGAPAAPFSISNVTVGFDASLDAKPAATVPIIPAPRPKPGKGLLSKAFSGDLPSGFPAEQQFSFPANPALKDCTARGFYGQDISNRTESPDVPLGLLRAAQAKHSIFNSERVRTAYDLAARAHRGQVRKNGDPVLAHCVDTALILAELGLGEELVAAGLLHDVLHDTKLNKYQLEEYMPTDVVRMVENVTKISKFSQSYRNTSDSNPASLVNAVTYLHDPKSVIVKLADRLHNMRTISSLPHDKQVGMASETLEVYTVLANRLGLWCLKAELEDLAFQVLHPKEFEQLSQQVNERKRAGFLEASVNQLKEHLQARGIQVEEICGRSKNLYGIYQKMTKDGSTLDKVFDVCAVRVIVKTKDECYLARREVFSLWRPLPERSKDFIRDKKENGYQSLHETVVEPESGLPFEVQIRTHKMHFMAEYGLSAHWRYKENSAADPACQQEECGHMDQLIKWQRWLTTYKFGVHDKKVRPVGSPPKDMSMASLGLQHIDSLEISGQQQKLDPLLCNDRFRLRPVSEQVSFPVSVILTPVGVTSPEIRLLPPGSTAAQLLAAQQLNAGSVCMLVNGREVSDWSSALATGDEIELLPAREQSSRSANSYTKGNVVPFPAGVKRRAFGQAVTV